MTRNIGYGNENIMGTDMYVLTEMVLTIRGSDNAYNETPVMIAICHEGVFPSF